MADLTEGEAEDTNRSRLGLLTILKVPLARSHLKSSPLASKVGRLGVNIYVGNLSFEVTEEELRREFVAFGEVRSIQILNRKELGSGQPTGYAYVDMSSQGDSWKIANSLNGKILRGRAIEVVVALPLTSKKK